MAILHSTLVGRIRTTVISIVIEFSGSNSIYLLNSFDLLGETRYRVARTERDSNSVEKLKEPAHEIAPNFIEYPAGRKLKKIKIKKPNQLKVIELRELIKNVEL